MTTKRFIFIDYCKTIAIILVILGHKTTPLTNEGIDFIYTFHMPLFFFISGFLFKRYDWKTQISKLKTGLLIPLCFFIFFSYITLYAPRNIIHHNYYDIYSFIKIMFTTPIIDSVRGLSVCDNGSLWFIYSLLLCIVTFRLLPEKIIRYQKKYFCFFLIIVPLLSMVWDSIFIENLPWNIQRHFIICCFFILGYNLKSYISYFDIKSIQISKLLTVFTIFFILYFIIYYTSDNILRWHDYSESILLSYQTFILSLLGIVFTITLSIILSKLIGNNRYIEFISNNTYTIFATEFVWEWNLHRIQLLTNIEFTPMEMIVIRFIIAIIFAFFINKYFPYLIGKKKNVVR